MVATGLGETWRRLIWHKAMQSMIFYLVGAVSVKHLEGIFNLIRSLRHSCCKQISELFYAHSIDLQVFFTNGLLFCGLQARKYFFKFHLVG